jgi:triosephosphate isomerase
MENRKPFIIANWKMHKTILEAVQFIRGYREHLKAHPAHVALAVPFTAIFASAEAAAGSPLMIGAQNMHEAAQGAFTGEVSAAMLKDAGASFVLLGHSERRRLFGEDDALINRKALRALECGLKPFICVGEMTSEHDKGRNIVKEQLLHCLRDLTPEQLRQCVISYEPIWAIGTGLLASPEYVQEIRQMSQELLVEHWGVEVVDRVPILYGGSVTAENAKEFICRSNVDGLLVGGASLSLASFMQIVDNVTEQT